MKINTEFYRIALVGTPGAGKTSVLKILKKSVATSAFKVGFIDEAATTIMRDPSIRALRSTDPVSFQEKVSVTQLFAEDTDLRAALSQGTEKYLQITDRALPDAYVYLNGEQRKELRFPLPSVEELNARYDAVICFELYCHGAHLKAGNDLRAEKALSDIKKVYEKSLRVYSKHPRFYLVSPCDDIRDKAAWVAKVISEIVGEKIFEVEISEE